jgi:phenylpropionate dioxygenase-like ring-hydroxylating dioxygenase large terminal subunit
MTYLRNAWYVAAWDDEVESAALFRRRILGEQILLMRDSSGTAHALRDRCPHRFAPLSLGKHHGDVIECAYHGLQFGMDGRCALNPQGDGVIPAGANARAYPLVAKDLLLWIWMGDPARADAADIPDFEGLDPQVYAIIKGYMHTPANYEIMTDNIMDLGHIEFLHEGLLGSEAVRLGETEVRQDGTVVISNRLVRDEILPPALEALFEAGGEPVDRWLDVRWHAPANMHLTVGVTPAGSPPRVGRETPGVHLMTPETESSTHYFWANARDFRRDDAALQQALGDGLRYAFEQQDKPMIQAVQDNMDGNDFWELRPVILACDAGAIRARRVLRKLISDEQSGRQPSGKEPVAVV